MSPTPASLGYFTVRLAGVALFLPAQNLEAHTIQMWEGASPLPHFLVRAESGDGADYYIDVRRGRHQARRHPDTGAQRRAHASGGEQVVEPEQAIRHRLLIAPDERECRDPAIQSRVIRGQHFNPR